MRRCGGLRHCGAGSGVRLGDGTGQSLAGVAEFVFGQGGPERLERFAVRVQASVGNLSDQLDLFRADVGDAVADEEFFFSREHLGLVRRLCGGLDRRGCSSHTRLKRYTSTECVQLLNRQLTLEPRGRVDHVLARTFRRCGLKQLLVVLGRAVDANAERLVDAPLQRLHLRGQVVLRRRLSASQQIGRRVVFNRRGLEAFAAAPAAKASTHNAAQSKASNGRLGVPVKGVLVEQSN